MNTKPSLKSHPLCSSPPDKEDGAISTLVIRGSTDNRMDDIERAIDDGVNTFKVLVRVSSSRLWPMLRASGRTLPGFPLQQS